MIERYRHGETRRRRVVVQPGQYSAGSETIVLRKAMTVEVTEQWVHRYTYQDGWSITEWHWDTAQELPPGWWIRLFRRLFRRSSLPVAQVVQR